MPRTRKDISNIPDFVRRQSDEVKAQAIDWTPELKYRRRLCLKAASWQAWADAAVPEAAALRPHRHEKQTFERADIGRFALHRLIIPHLHYATEVIFWMPRSYWEVGNIPLYRYGREYGQVYFDGDVAIPVLADDRLKPVMSPTPSEVLSQRAGIRAARGRVLIAGLGLGWFAREVRRKKGVQSVTVVEKDPDIAACFGPGFLAAPGAPAAPVRIDDFYATDLSGFDSILVDIWQGAGDAGWDGKFQAIKQDMKVKGVKFWGWGDYVPRE